MVKKMTNNMSLKSLKISWWGQNSVAGHILLPSASGGSKKPFSYVRSSLIFMMSDYCHHLFIIRWSAAKRRPASTSWSRWTALWTSSHTWFSSSIIHLSSSSGFGLNASNFIKYIDYLASRADHLCYINSFLVFSLMAWCSVGKMKKVPSSF